MTDPLTPAALDELGRLYHEAKEPWDSVRQRLDSRAELADALVDAASALIAAARERDALRTELAEANYWRHNYADAVKATAQERDEANALLEDCAGQFLMSKDDGTVHHSFMSTEEALCRHLVKIGRLVPEGHERFKWAEQKTTTPTGQEKAL